MFERYTEKARRIIFYSRYEASQFGTPYIEVDQLLLGLLREDKALFGRLLRDGESERQLLENEVRALRTPATKFSTSVDIPLSHGAKRVLAFAVEEAERLGHKHIGTGHLLHGVIREPSLASGLLEKHHLDFEAVERELTSSVEKTAGSAAALSSLQEQFQRLTARLTHEIEPALFYHLP